jgi:hypothetical protein
MAAEVSTMSRNLSAPGLGGALVRETGVWATKEDVSQTSKSVA